MCLSHFEIGLSTKGKSPLGCSFSQDRKRVSFGCDYTTLKTPYKKKIGRIQHHFEQCTYLKYLKPYKHL